MNRINRIDAHIQRLKILIGRRKKAGIDIDEQLKQIEHLVHCKSGNHVFVKSLFENDQYCKHCFMNKIKNVQERV